ncbi:30S ribosomal protein S6 [Patescibacteria group bacterium]
MKQYELTYLTSASLSENDLKELQDIVNSSIVEAEGTLDEIKSPIKKELEYPVKKEPVVFLNTVIFHLSPEKLDVLEKRIDEDSRIISRMFLVKKSRKFIEKERRPHRISPVTKETSKKEKPKKVEIEEIEKKLEEILGE